MALDTAQKAEIVAKFAKKQNDTGSSEVQIALLTKRIIVLTAHLQENLNRVIFNVAKRYHILNHSKNRHKRKKATSAIAKKWQWHANNRSHSDSHRYIYTRINKDHQRSRVCYHARKIVGFKKIIKA